MLPKKLFILFFAIMCLIQWIVPLNLIFKQEDTLNFGTVFKFKTMPVDPVDVFRGRYIQLRFVQNTFPLDTNENWQSGETAYALLTKDVNGFATITGLSRNKPHQDADFITVTIDYVYKDSLDQAVMSFPFDKFYMQEDKAPEAEKFLNLVQQDSSSIIYAKVKIKNGFSSLADVIVDNQSLQDALQNSLVK